MGGWRGRSSDTANALDELKPALGLSPHAAVFPDRRGIAAFDQVFQAAEDWSRRPDRNLAELPQIIGRLPAIGDVVVNGRPILPPTTPILPAIGPAPGSVEDRLRDATRLAIRNHPDKGQDPGDGAVVHELRVRRRVRRLLEIRGGYEEAKRSYELAIRLRDQAFERAVTPSTGVGVASRGPLVQGVIDAVGRGHEAQDRLIAHWTSFQAERLSLYRDLGVLPYDSWRAFHADLSAPGRAADEPAPAVAPAVLEPAAPAPPPPVPPPSEP